MDMQCFGQLLYAKTVCDDCIAALMKKRKAVPALNLDAPPAKVAKAKTAVVIDLDKTRPCLPIYSPAKQGQ